MSRLARAGTAAVDTGPVLVLAGIAGTGSFAHIRDTASEHGQSGPMAWAIAVCIDLTCVMAARERQRDKRTGRHTRMITWPTIVLAGGILLSLAANLAQAEPTLWGWLTAGTPCGAFLVAVSMLERRRSTTPTPAATDGQHVQDPADRPGALVPTDTAPVPTGPAPSPAPSPAGDSSPSSSPSSSSSAGPADALLTFARRVADEHRQRHGRPITRDALRARLGVSNQLASDLLRHIRTDPTQETA
jgi:hypothetical protein